MAILPDLVHYDTELLEYNTITPYPHMNERCPGLPPVYKRPGECWTRELNISDHPPVKYDRFTKIVLMMNTIVQNAWWDVDCSCQILGICRCHLWTSLNSTWKKNVVIRWTLKACQYIYMSYCWLFMIHFCFHTFSNLLDLHIVMLGTNCTFVRWAKTWCTKHKISPI